jgi:hypothetical protein
VLDRALLAVYGLFCHLFLVLHEFVSPTDESGTQVSTTLRLVMPEASLLEETLNNRSEEELKELLSALRTKRRAVDGLSANHIASYLARSPPSNAQVTWLSPLRLNQLV